MPGFLSTLFPALNQPGGGQALAALGSYLMAAGSPSYNPGASGQFLAQAGPAFQEALRQARLDAQNSRMRDLQSQALEQNLSSLKQKSASDAQAKQLLLGTNNGFDYGSGQDQYGIPNVNISPRQLGGPQGAIGNVPEAIQPYVRGLAQIDPQKAFELGITAAMPKYQSVGPDQSLISIDPYGNGKPQTVYQGPPQPKSGIGRINADVAAKLVTPEEAQTAIDRAGGLLSSAALAQQKDLIKTRSEATLAAQMGDAADMQNLANNIAHYKVAPLSGFAMAKPAGQAIMGMVTQINPQYNAQNFTKSQQAYKDFASGKKGDLVRSFNVSISHLGTLEKLSTALQNSDIQAVNSLKNTFREQFGSDAPTNFNAAKAIVGDEIIKAIVGSGGALADRENAQNQIRAANTPAQLAGVVRTYKELMAGQLGGLKRQYEQSTMRDDFNSLLSPEAQSQLENATMQSASPLAPANNPQSILDRADQIIRGGP